MNLPDDVVEDEFFTLLAECDEALATGLPAPPEPADATAALKARLRCACECLQVLERIWPRTGRPASASRRGLGLSPSS
jgi:hypothetical protein